MTDFTDAQQAALATATVVYPAGISLIEDRVHDIEVADSLVESGHLIPVESEDIDGKGYVLSPVMAEAHQRVAAAHADEAGMN